MALARRSGWPIVAAGQQKLLRLKPGFFLMCLGGLWWFMVVLGVFFPHLFGVLFIDSTIVTNVVWGDGDRERWHVLAKLSDLTVTEHWNHG